ncbi:DUF6153 family protein [Agrococcus carbonis]|uniref:Uncharacterized protein n=1 Tax=Agrococcus carbonis TaxID=684552 RepID=A0A1H1RBJ1_9MICO|nr:DUF6153 family protein [Agrococcus carbonis]SDS33078.1 hypothetical protein SAMN04489719_2073 [Agrococcus carbonis]
MRALSSRPAGAAPRARILLALVLAVAGVLVGLLGMHVLGGGTHAAHDAAPAESVSHSMGEDQTPAVGHCGDTGCDELGLMAVSCVLALLALTSLLPASPARWFLRTIAPPTRSFALPAQFVPTPSLISLSISRT